MIDPALPPPPLPPARSAPRPSVSVSSPWIMLGGAAYGLLMRILFGLWPFGHGNAGGAGPMLVSFLFLVPLVIGVWSVSRLAPERRTLGMSLILPWGPTALFVTGTAILAIEGSICIALAIPIFLIMASIGGLIAWIVLRFKPPVGATNAVLVLPLILGVAEQQTAIPDAHGHSTESIHIAARPEKIWHLINDATGIAPSEMAQGWAWRIGVPYPVSAVTVEEDGQRVRKLKWQKGVHFDEPILDWNENRYIRWSYRFAPDSIPPGALDEHVEVGGRYFDLVDTSYRLEPEGDGTRLTIDVNYRISTRFNWYAARLGRFLVDDAAQTILDFYKHRSETDARNG